MPLLKGQRFWGGQATQNGLEFSSCTYLLAMWSQTSKFKSLSHSFLNRKNGRKHLPSRMVVEVNIKFLGCSLVCSKSYIIVDSFPCTSEPIIPGTNLEFTFYSLMVQSSNLSSLEIHLCFATTALEMKWIFNQYFLKWTESHFQAQISICGHVQKGRMMIQLLWVFSHFLNKLG